MNHPADFPLIFERSAPGRAGILPPEPPADFDPAAVIPAAYLRREPPALPEVDELTLVRHYTELSRRNGGIDNTFYPLGSCTMKYNPRVHEAVAALPGFADLHPYQDLEHVQGALALWHGLERALAEIGGFAACTLQPAAGAQGELLGLLVIKAYLDEHRSGRTTVLIPDSAHGTNPASCSFAGFRTQPVRSNARGLLDLEDLKRRIDERTAALMITNPNTLGLFEEQIAALARVAHDAGAQVYMDGANFNAIVGQVRPGDFGVDVMHFNLHKTFSTPHGCGGPGAGPLGVAAHLAPYLPVPRVERRLKDGGERFTLREQEPKSVGRIRGFFGNFGVLVRAYAYIRRLGREGLPRVAEHAVLNANYLRALLAGHFALPYDGPTLHEFVLSAPADRGAGATDLAKALIDRGFHPPTIHFPLIVPQALMIEPTETESKETLDAFAAALIDLARQGASDHAALAAAPRTKPVGRLDEVRATRRPIFRWQPESPGRSG